MNSLWSPWRSQYVGSSDEREKGECFLCRCAAQPEPTFDNLVVARFTSTMVVMNRYPYNAGHLLIAPYEHQGELTALSTLQSHELMDVLSLAVRVTQEVLKPQGCNVGANLGSVAGAGVPNHLHLHTVPRWLGDTNFMPTVADTKVMSQSMEDLWIKFREAFLRAHTE
ncbi:MAG: HIT domain-containing protein [bacterium]|nr:HIT domain-containing protein [bacterium]